MVAGSLLLHGLLLLLPLPESQSIPEPEEPEEEEVQLSSISSLKVSPQPVPTPIAPSPTPKPIVRPLAASPALIPPPRPPLPTPTVTPTPVATPTPTPTVTPTPVATPTPLVTPTPVVTAPLELGSLQSGTVAGVGQASAAQFYTNFPEPAAFFTPESLAEADANLTDPIPVNGITNMTRIELKSIEETQAEILPQLYPGATFTPIGIYGGGDLYEVRQADSVGYIVLLKEAGLSLATFVIEWNINPTQLAGQF
ncbi:MAG: hypothetical protein MUF72_14835 [Elainella sp. Prado103]|nr:hypothetical protein [Elainella sp. Prado103]